MISAFFNATFYDPIYNALVALIAAVPTGDAGVAVVLLTIVIRLILLPFSLSAARTQRAMQELSPRLKELKEKHKGDKEKEALETLALYKDAKVNPFSSILIALIQIPVLLALYFVFFHESFSIINEARIYAFTPLPDSVSLDFLGLIPVTGQSILLALLAAATQYLQARVALQGTMKPTGGGMAEDFQRMMGVQLMYVFPILIGIISFTTSSALALYFITTNLAGIAQEFYVRKKLVKAQAAYSA